jgi:hypothetical protein
MPSKLQLQVDLIPYQDQLYVNRLRTYLNDTVEKNILEGVEESTDIELYHAIQDTIDEINYEFSPATNYSEISDIPS